MANKERILTVRGFIASDASRLTLLMMRGSGSEGIPVNEKTSDVEVRDFYGSYTPPRYAAKTVRMLLSTVPEKYLRGLDCIVLTNQSEQPRRHRLGKVTSRKMRFPQSRVLGRYHHASRGGRAWIELFVDKIDGVAGQFWLPLMREVTFGRVLFHEIGHHIHTRLPEYSEKEDTADRWMSKLLANFIRQKYWYLVPVRKPLAYILKAWVDIRRQ